MRKTKDLQQSAIGRPELNYLIFKSRIFFLVLAGIVLGALSYMFLALPDVADATIPSDAAAIERGAYLVSAGGCVSCHRGQSDESAASLSGGLALETDFGTFYAPNITPDEETGIGSWSGQDFLLALKHGRTPDGSFYYPAFPYKAYGGLTDADVLDMAAYLLSLEPVSQETPSPEAPFWLMRWTVSVWNRLADVGQPELEQFDPASQPLMARGAYLARHLGHCGECHTPRSGLGIPDLAQEYAGAELGEEVIEAIDAAALEDWTTNNFDVFLLLGLKPEGEFVGGDMNEVIEDNTSKLSEEDRDALAAFFTRHNL